MTSESGRDGRRRRRLSPAMRAFLAVDVVLVLAFLAVLLMTRSGDAEEPTSSVVPPASTTRPPSGPSAAEAPEDEASVTGTADADPGEGELFASPSGNIVCSISSDAASCSIAELLDEGLVEDEECRGTVGHVVRVTAEGDTERPCLTGAPPGAAPEATPVLEYEDSTSALGFTCTSSRSGIICRHDATGHGFSIARAGSSLF